MAEGTDDRSGRQLRPRDLVMPGFEHPERLEEDMLDIVRSGGWLMAPIIACSIVALAVIAERLWYLRRRRLMPEHLVAQVYRDLQSRKLDAARLKRIRNGSLLGRLLAVVVDNRHRDRISVRDSIDEASQLVLHDLERYLNTLGTIAAVSPLLGLLGTVIGMIDVFTAIAAQGVGNPQALSGGISQALITTAAGLSVAIPSLMFYRYFRGRVDELIGIMEGEALKLADGIQEPAESLAAVREAP